MKYVVLCTERVARAQWKLTVGKQINLLIHFIELFLGGKPKVGFILKLPIHGSRCSFPKISHQLRSLNLNLQQWKPTVSSHSKSGHQKEAEHLLCKNNNFRLDKSGE